MTQDSETRAKPKAILWDELKSVDIEPLVLKNPIALLPVGSTEQHGPHLPLGTDNIVAFAIGKLVSERTAVPVLPLIPYAPCDWHTAFPGTISLPAESFADLVFHVVRSVADLGIRHVIAINGHTGGNNPALLMAADRVIRNTSARLWVADVVMVAHSKITAIAESKVLGHADEIETSEILAIRHDLVDLSNTAAWEMEPHSSHLSKSYRRGSSILSRISADEWRSLAPQGYTGDPTVATAGKGEQMLEAAAAGIITFIKELSGGDVFAPRPSSL